MGYEVVATLGTRLGADLVDALRHFGGHHLVFDLDDARLEATLLLQHELGSTSISVAPPDGIKQRSQVARQQDGQQLFAPALLKSVGQRPIHWQQPLRRCRIYSGNTAVTELTARPELGYIVVIR